jgi:Holliday junction resolvasome RuvABC endonuclease subunit
MEINIGIDPSINSTGISWDITDNGTLIHEEFIILKSDEQGKRHLTAREKAALKLDNFSYVFYDKLKQDSKDNLFNEQHKSKNVRELVKSIENIIYDIIFVDIWKYISIENDDTEIKLNICQEAISYGSRIKTRSIFDLAGLNFVIRYMVYDVFKMLDFSSSIQAKFIRTKNYMVVPPSNIKKFISGNGNANKDKMNELFLISHPSFEIIPKVDDISDAWAMKEFVKHY